MNSLIQNILAQAIARDFCPPAGAIVSLTKVSASGNLQEVKVYISVIPDRQRAAVIAELERGVTIFQNVLNKKMRTRPVPKIIFVPDSNPAQAQEVETILEQLKKS